MLEKSASQALGVVGYGVFAADSDGELGYVEELIVDAQCDTISYLVVNTRKWLPVERVLLSTRHIQYVDRRERALELRLTKAMIRSKSWISRATASNALDTRRVDGDLKLLQDTAHVRQEHRP